MNIHDKKCSVKEAAEYLHCSLSTVYRRIKVNQLIVSREGGRFLILEKSVQQRLDEGDPEKFTKEYI